MVKTKHRIASVLVMLVLVVGLPLSANAANIQGGVPSITVNSTVIAFGGQEWYVIGYNDGINVPSGVYTVNKNSLTLLLKGGQTAEPRPFSDSIFHSTSSDYSGSELQRAMLEAANTLDIHEKALVNPRTLTTTDGIGGADAENQLFWPLSEAERGASGINNPTVCAYTRNWWLRSPNGTDEAEFVIGDGSTSGHAAVNTQCAVRPALNLNLSSVIFTSAATGGKPTTPNAVLEQAQAPTSPLKLTVRDDNLSCSAEVTNVSGKDITFDYEIAGTCNRLAAIVQGENGDAKFYGYLKENPGTSGTATLTVPDGLTASDTLLVFAEQVNGDLNTDYASSPNYIMMKDTPTGLSVVNCTTSANNDGKITGTTTEMEYSADGGATWQSCTANEITGLVPGDYMVRIKAMTVNGIVVTSGGISQVITIEPYTAAPTVGSITAPAPVNVGQTLSLTAPTVTDNGAAITAQGWQISQNGTDGWEAFDPATPMAAAHNGQYLQYAATNSKGTGTSKTVQITVNGGATDHSVIQAPDTLVKGQDAVFVLGGEHANVSGVAVLHPNGARTDLDLVKDGNAKIQLGDGGKSAGDVVPHNSVKVTLYAAWLDTLPAGKYTLTVSFNDGGVQSSGRAGFVLTRAQSDTPTPTTAPPPDPGPGSPQTGDTSNMLLWVLCSGAALLGLALIRRRVAQR